MADAPRPARPLTFLEFCARIGVKLEAGQLVYAKVAFDGVQPRDLQGDERELAKEIFGDDLEEVPADKRRIVCAVFGGRAGKTYIGALRALHLGLTAPLDKLAKGQAARVWFVAPEMDLASEAMAYVKGIFDAFPKLKKRVLAESEKRLLIRRKDGARVAFEIKAAKGKGMSTRGRVIIACLLDEAAFFMNADYVVNDVEIFQAIQPRVSIHGQLLIQSTPWTETGLLYDLFSANHTKPDKCLAAYAPTPVMRTDPDILQQVQNGYDLDPENAEREFGAKFLSAATITWFDPKQIDAAVDDTLETAREPQPGDYVAAAGDLAFARNSSALAVAHRPANDNDEAGPNVILAEVVERRPQEGEPLRPSDVCKGFVTIIVRHRAQAMIADGHYRETAREYLEAAGLLFRDAPSDTTVPWVTVRALLRQGALRLPPDKQLIKELKGVKWQALSGGRVQIRLPKTKDGRHCDVAAASVLAIDAVWREPADRVPAVPRQLDQREQQLEKLRTPPKAGRHWMDRMPGGRRAA